MSNRFTSAFYASLIALGAIALAPVEMKAVKAYPHPIVKTQPDGSQITIRMMGDEYGHYILSDDGKMLTESNGGYYYSMPEGKISPMLAQNSDVRSPEASSLLMDLDQQAMISNVKKYAAESPRRAKAQKITPVMPGKPFPGLFDHAFPTTGKHKSIVILVEYADVYFRDHNPREYFNRMLNEKDFSENGCYKSARDYFIDSSNGQFEPTFEVYGPVRLKNPRKYYGGNDGRGNDMRPQLMAIEACQALDSEVDFSEFDLNNDGLIDNVFIFYAGQGEATGGPAESVWPHSFDVAYSHELILDGKRLSTYACSNELVPRDGNREDLYLDTIGTFCHEFGHVMGLPDLYSTDYSDAHDPGTWSIMASGSYNNNGSTPPVHSSFEKAALGWLVPEPIPNGELKMIPLTSENKAYIIPTEKADEFFLIEMRTYESWDEYLPGNGMLVWHIDYDKKVWDQNTCNNDANHQHIDIVEAHGSELSAFRAFDAFPGLEESMDFTPDTTPALRSWSGADLGVRIRNIVLDEDGYYVTMTVENDNGAGIVSAEGEKLYRQNGKIITAFADIEVFDIQGRRVDSAKAGNDIELPQTGIYIVNTPSGAYKIAAY